MAVGSHESKLLPRTSFRSPVGSGGKAVPGFAIIGAGIRADRFAIGE
jgi:hypothetical protein